MITCPVCSHVNADGTLICSNCNHLLVNVTDTRSTVTLNIPAGEFASMLPAKKVAVLTDDEIELYVEGSSIPIVMHVQQQVLFGTSYPEYRCSPVCRSGALWRLQKRYFARTRRYPTYSKQLDAYRYGQRQRYDDQRDTFAAVHAETAQFARPYQARPIGDRVLRRARSQAHRSELQQRLTAYKIP